MIDNIPRISVIIITYNQENVIDRTLRSLLSQKDYIYEICISDDHSTDKTWDILHEYETMYSGLFKLNRNEVNLGIFDNTEKVWSMPTGDIVYDLAGDDEAGEGWFKKVIDFITENEIDYKNELYSIYGDYTAIYPNGDRFIFKNNKIVLGKDSFSMALRGLVNGRGRCYSMAIHKMFVKVSHGRSHIVERAQDNQVYCFTKNTYYIPSCANIYYTNIGISANLSNELLDERLQIFKFSEDFYRRIGRPYTKKDLAYTDFEIASVTYASKKTMSSFFKMCFMFFRAIDPNLPEWGLNSKRYFFAILRRLPHRKPLEMTL